MVSNLNIPSVVTFADGVEALVKSSEALTETVGRMASEVTVTLAVSSVCGDPIQEQRGTLTAENFRDYLPAPGAREKAIAHARELGFEIVRSGRAGITVKGNAELVSEVCKTPLSVYVKSRPSRDRSVADFSTDFSEPGPEELFLAPPGSLSLRADIDDALDHFVFTPPPVYFSPTANAPGVSYHTIDEMKIRSLLNVPGGFDGDGVTVGVVDTGFYRHPYYAAKNFNYRPVPTQGRPNPTVDNVGHGTAITYNVFAVAPGAQVLGFQNSNPPQDALEDAADAEVDIISCSWGFDREQIFPILQASLLSIIQQGVIVLFAAGNGHYAWPGSEPDVLSIGGVYADAARRLEASNYASGFMSSMFPARRVPDVCGLCGERPKGIYITMPTQPGCRMDQDLGGIPFPNRDETGKTDGWVGASGTSSATPQVAGVAALLVQKARSKGVRLKTQDVRLILEQSAKPVLRGRNAHGFPANGQPSTAVGWGLVDASAALNLI